MPAFFAIFCAQRQQLVEDLFDLLASCSRRSVLSVHASCARRAVRLLVKSGHLLQRVFLAAELDHHRAADLVVLGDELGDLRLQRHVFVAERFRRPPAICESRMA